MLEKTIKLRSLNSHITCNLCKGYLIDATTITECLHTFCKSCIVKYLEEHNSCPVCADVVHQSHPLQYISYDRTMQDIVYKLVPHLQQNEMQREREFYKQRGLACPKDALVYVAAAEEDKNRETVLDADYHHLEEQINICLECAGAGAGASLAKLKKKFVRCSSKATIRHLQRFVAGKVLDGLDNHAQIDILCNNERMDAHLTLKFIYVMHWRFLEPPLVLQYRLHAPS